MRRRDMLFSSASCLTALATAQEKDPPKTVPAWEAPLWNLRTQIQKPVTIASLSVLERDGNYFVRATSTDGLQGVIECKHDVVDYLPILLRRVIPAFTGKDARNLETLIDDVYIRNYKVSGQAFWLPVGCVDQCLMDLLGRTVNKPSGALMGGIIRREIPVYLSGSGRDTTAEEEVDIYVAAAQETNTTAVKFKIGGRMSRNADQYPGRTKTLCTLARKRLGDDGVLYADANGSYDHQNGIRVGRMLQDLNFRFFEEPCPWEELSETKLVADALDIPIAGGEVDHSLWRYDYMIRNQVVQIVQPDLNYNGGFVRAGRVARMAKEHGIVITPHSTQTGANGANILTFASCTPNTGAHMEFPYRGAKAAKQASWYAPHWKITNGKIALPGGPGLGVTIDPDYLKGARVLQA